MTVVQPWQDGYSLFRYACACRTANGGPVLILCFPPETLYICRSLLFVGPVALANYYFGFTAGVTVGAVAVGQTKAGLVFKSIIQKPATGEEEGDDVQDGMYRFIVLYLTRFRDNIQLPAGSRLEVQCASNLDVCCHHFCSATRFCFGE